MCVVPEFVWTIRDGQAWVAGDVITCCIDLTPGMDGGTVSYLRNGIPLGVAFSNVRRFAPGLAYFPAVSLSVGERCCLNFGAAPMRYPVEGYVPLQASPDAAALAAVERGLGIFERLAVGGATCRREPTAPAAAAAAEEEKEEKEDCLLYTSPSPRDATLSRMPSSA